LIERTNINLMALPGQVSKTSARFDAPGEYRFFCHEYCGLGHQIMWGKVIVEPRG
jgi:cytochrome c oxidase subunit 2